MNVKDYLYGRMTGRFGYTDYSDASLTIALDIGRRRWASEMLGELGIDVQRMPRLLAGHDVAGRVSREAAQRTGLTEGTPVAIGGGDGACTARGAGVSEPGDAYCYIGSSAWVSQIRPAPVFDPEARIFNYLDMDGASYHVCGTVQCGAAAFDWALRNFFGGDAPDDIARAEEMARGVRPGAEGVFLPADADGLAHALLGREHARLPARLFRSITTGGTSPAPCTRASRSRSTAASRSWRSAARRCAR